MTLSINGVDYVSNKNIVSLETGWKNNIRMDSGAAGQGGYSAAGVAFGTWPATFGSSFIGPWNWSIYISS